MDGKNFFGRPIQPVHAVQDMRYDTIVVTSYLKRKELFKELIDVGVDKESIRIFLT
jgi:hypothetical protein